jgi:small subunit ribosomal protein S1
MSWTRRVGHPSEILKKGEKVVVKVLNIDKDARRISLGLKQVTDDPWPEIQTRYPIGMTVKGRVVKAIDRGVIILVDGEVEGFVPATHLGIENFRHPGEHFKADDELDLKVTRIDLANHRMVLSIKAWLQEQDPAIQKEFVDTYSEKRATVTESDEGATDVPEDVVEEE